MLERQLGQHDRPRRLGKLARVTLTASMIAGGASLVPANVTVNLSPSNAEGATTCVPFHDVKLSPSTALQTIENVKRGILTGDVSIPKKGLFHDSNNQTGQLIIIDLPTTGNISDVEVNNEASVRVYNSCAPDTQFNAGIGAAERSNTPKGNAKYEEGTHRVTNNFSESYITDPETSPCTIFNGNSLPITQDGQTISIMNIKNDDLIIGDVTVRGFKPDSDPASGMAIHVVGSGNLTGVQSPNGGFEINFRSCATQTQKDSVIGNSLAAKSAENPNGEILYTIKLP